MKIYINNEQNKIEVPLDIEESLKTIAQLVFEEEGLSDNYEISLTLVDDNQIRELNRDYRGKDTPTDVLSFPLIEDFELEAKMDNEMEILLGDIVISLERAVEQSKEYSHSLNRELVYLMIHSLFHLVGYDHIDEEDKKKMRSKEKEIIRKIKVFRNEI